MEYKLVFCETDLIGMPVMASGIFLFAAAGFELSILYADILMKKCIFFCPLYVPVGSR